MSTSFRHEVLLYYLESGGMKRRVVASKKFRNSFVRSAYSWFDSIVKKEYGGFELKRVNDTSITGYHWNVRVKGEVIGTFEMH